MPTHDPKIEIKNDNPWYTDDQFEVQYQRYSSREVIFGRWRFFRKTINDFLQDKKETVSILDAGCGDGINLMCLSEFKDRAKIFACDFNDIRLKKVDTRYNKSQKTIHTKKLDLLNPDLTQKYDIILLSQVLEHIKEDKKVLDNLYKLLDNNGILIIGVPNEGSILARLRNNVFDRQISKTTDHVNFYKEKSFKSLLHEANFNYYDKVYDGTIYLPNQYLQLNITRFKIGFKFLILLRTIFPSQAGGYYFACRKIMNA